MHKQYSVQLIIRFREFLLIFQQLITIALIVYCFFIMVLIQLICKKRHNTVFVLQASTFTGCVLNRKMNTVYLENIILSLSQPLPLSPHSALSFSNLLAIFIHSLIMFVVILIPHSYMFALLLMTIFFTSESNVSCSMYVCNVSKSNRVFLFENSQIAFLQRFLIINNITIKCIYLPIYPMFG